MAHTIWQGIISFRGTKLPVNLKPAVSQDRFQFHLLHRTDQTKLRQQMVCAHEKKPVPAAEEVKGYLIAARKYVLVSPAELKRTEAAAAGRDITVHQFVKTGAVDPAFLERTYYLEPKGPVNDYAALAAALQETASLGICTWTMKKRSYLGALGSDGRTLRLTLLRFADELVPARSLNLGSFKLSDKELGIAAELIKKLTAPWRPDQFRNEHEEKLRALIGRKARGGKIVLVKPRPARATAPDELLRKLEESLKAAV